MPLKQVTKFGREQINGRKKLDKNHKMMLRTVLKKKILGAAPSKPSK